MKSAKAKRAEQELKAEQEIRERTKAGQNKLGNQILDRRIENIRTLLRQAQTSDFQIRMRNQLALELQDDEHVLDDEPVFVFRGGQLGIDAAGSALPLLGVLVVTNRRIRFATVDDPVAVDAPLDAVRLTHDEDGELTFLWNDATGKQAATVTFRSARAGLIKQIRRVLQDDKIVGSGPATPRITSWDRISRPRRR